MSEKNEQDIDNEANKSNYSDDEYSQISDAKSWAETDPAKLLETLTATEILHRDEGEDYPWLMNLLMGEGWNASRESAQQIVVAVKAESLEAFKVALELAFPKPSQSRSNPRKSFAADGIFLQSPNAEIKSSTGLWDWVRTQRAERATLEGRQEIQNHLKPELIVYMENSSTVHGGSLTTQSLVTPSAGPEGPTPKRYLSSGRNRAVERL